jgi:hypothetical protein
MKAIGYNNYKFLTSKLWNCNYILYILVGWLLQLSVSSSQNEVAAINLVAEVGLLQLQFLRKWKIYVYVSLFDNVTLSIRDEIEY